MTEATAIVVSVRFGVVFGIVNMRKLQTTVVFQVFTMEIFKRAKHLKERLSNTETHILKAQYFCG